MGKDFLLALGSQSQQHLRTMLDYGRELFSIAAAGMSMPALGAPGADTVAAATSAAASTTASIAERLAEPVNQAAGLAIAETAATDMQAPVRAASTAEFALPTEAAAEASIVTSNIEPDSAPTAIAKATSEALDVPVAPPHPVAASMPVEVAVEIELPKVEPVDATPPPAAVTGRPAETRGTKGRRRQN